MDLNNRKMTNHPPSPAPSLWEAALETERRCFSKVIFESTVTPKITRYQTPSVVPPIVNGGDWGCIERDLETIIVLVLLAFNFIPQRSHHSLTLPRSRIRLCYWSVRGTPALTLLISTLPNSYPTTLNKLIPLELLHSHSSPFPLYRGTIQAPRQSIGTTPIQNLSLTVKLSIPTLPYHLSLNIKQEIHPALEPYQI